MKSAQNLPNGRAGVSCAGLLIHCLTPYGHIGTHKIHTHLSVHDPTPCSSKLYIRSFLFAYVNVVHVARNAPAESSARTASYLNWQMAVMHSLLLQVPD